MLRGPPCIIIANLQLTHILAQQSSTIFDGGSLMEESRKDMGLAAIRGACSLEGFSIDCDSGVRRADSFRPTHEAKIDGFSVNGLDKAADGGFTGG